MRFLTAFLFGVLLSVPSVRAAEFDSAYTKLHLDQCAFTPPAEDDPVHAGNWLCSGYQGIPVAVTEVDLRMSLSFGPKAMDEKAFQQTLPVFNNIAEVPVLEWRLFKGKPIATILRWFIDDGMGQKTEVLVVTQYAPGRSCHVGYVDAKVNRGANQLARDVADGLAQYAGEGGMPCPITPQIHGAPGMLAN